MKCNLSICIPQNYSCMILKDPNLNGLNSAAQSTCGELFLKRFISDGAMISV